MCVEGGLVRSSGVGVAREASPSTRRPPAPGPRALVPGPGPLSLVPGPGPLSLVPGPGPLSLVPGPGPLSLVPGPGPWSRALGPRGLGLGSDTINLESETTIPEQNSAPEPSGWVPESKTAIKCTNIYEK